MLDFVRNLGNRVIGVLSGFDRMLFRGILTCVINPRGLNGYLYGAKVAMTDFDQHAKQVSGQVIDQSLQWARQAGCEIRYIDNSHTRKQDVALQIMHSDGIQDGLVCVLKALDISREDSKRCEPFRTGPAD